MPLTTPQYHEIRKFVTKNHIPSLGIGCLLVIEDQRGRPVMTLDPPTLTLNRADYADLIYRAKKDEPGIEAMGL